MNLFRAELARLFARQFVRLMTLLLLAACGLTVAVALADSHRPTPAVVAEAEAQAAAHRIELARYEAECRAAHEPGASEAMREKWQGSCGATDPAEIRMEHFLPEVFVFAVEIQPLALFLAGFLTLFGFLLGASFVGAELHSGGMTNLLLWRPQRGQVLGAKLAAVLGTVLLTGVVVSAGYVGVLWLVGQTVGFAGELSADGWASLALLVLRGLGLSAVATAVAFAIATLGRHTAAALGVVAAYAVVWEVGARIVMSVVEVGRPEQWVFSSYLAAWLDGSVQFFDNRVCGGSFSEHCDPSYTITWPVAGLALGVLLAVAVSAAFTSFRRRDLA